MASAAGSVFGRQTTAPPGMANEPNPTQGNNAKFSTGNEQGQEQGDQGTVPVYEGAESGNVTDSVPVNQGNEQGQGQGQEQNQGNEQGNEQNQGQEQGQEQVTQIDPVALALRETSIEAREAKLAAEEAKFYAQNNPSNPNTPPPEEEKSILADIDEESFESEGERTLFNVAKQLETELKSATQKADAAELEAARVRSDSNINRVVSQYDVTEAELIDKYNQTGVGDLDTLAKSILFEKGQTAQSQGQANQGVQTRTNNVTKQGASNNSGAPNNTTTQNQEPVKRGVTNPFDGAQVAQKYQAFTRS